MSHERPLIGKRIKTLREAAELTQQQLATSAGISLSNLSQLEQGQKEDPRLSTVEAIASALGIGIDELIGSEANKAAEATKKPARGKRRGKGE